MHRVTPVTSLRLAALSVTRVAHLHGPAVRGLRRVVHRVVVHRLRVGRRRVVDVVHELVEHRLVSHELVEHRLVVVELVVELVVILRVGRVLVMGLLLVAMFTRVSARCVCLLLNAVS